MDIPELSKALCEEQTLVVQRYLDGVEKALLSYGWEMDIIGPSYISPSFVEIVACYWGYPFTLAFSDSGNTVHAYGRTVPALEVSARSVKNLTTKGMKALAGAPYLSAEAASLLVQRREARVVHDRSPKNRQIFVKLSREANAKPCDRTGTGERSERFVEAMNLNDTLILKVAFESALPD